MDKEWAVPVISVPIPIDVFLLPDDSLPTGTDADLLVAAKSPKDFYELSQHQIGEAFPS